MFQTEGKKETRVISGSVSRAGVTEMREHFRKMPDWSFGDILSPSVSSKQILKLLWISQGGKEPASVIRGEIGGGGVGREGEQWRKNFMLHLWKHISIGFTESHPKAAEEVGELMGDE